jgi:hypothetical protein
VGSRRMGGSDVESLLKQHKAMVMLAMLSNCKAVRSSAM